MHDVYRKHTFNDHYKCVLSCSVVCCIVKLNPYTELVMVAIPVVCVHASIAMGFTTLMKKRFFSV